MKTKGRDDLAPFLCGPRFPLRAAGAWRGATDGSPQADFKFTRQATRSAGYRRRRGGFCLAFFWNRGRNL